MVCLYYLESVDSLYPSSFKMHRDVTGIKLISDHI